VLKLAELRKAAVPAEFETTLPVTVLDELWVQVEGEIARGAAGEGASVKKL